MPWQETSPVDQRDRFITDSLRGLFSMTELCARYGISRKSGYKWLGRFQEGGRAALRDRSRAPHSCPHRIAASVAELLCQARARHPDWGPEKLLHWLAPRHPAIAWPAVSTVGDLLARRGLVKKRRRRRRPAHPGTVLPLAPAPNALWTADFKGHFRTGDGHYCYPLTIADQHSRYLLRCHGLPTTRGGGVHAVFRTAFRTYGLPRAIRTDNGVPFASQGLRGLSQLTVWWLRLGIQHQRIQPARPEQNGVHERMHRTLKAAVCRPPRASLAAQQRAFNRFRVEFNDERPHQALRGRPPAAVYRPSPRLYPETLPRLEYPGHFLVKRVTDAGTVRFHRRLLFVSRALKQHPIGLSETGDGIWSIYLGSVLLGRVDERDYLIRD
jgi:transposase InsO family protein